MASTFILQLFLAAIVPALADIQMKFTKYPESVIAPVGANVTFECEVTVPGERLTWRWALPNHTESSWTEVAGVTDKNVHTKLIVEVKSNTVDTLYQCVVWYGPISLVSVPAKLTVAKMIPSKSSTRKRVVTAPPHNTVVLHCKEPISEPPAVIQWWREIKNVRKQIESRHGVLVIHNATADDSGTYICSATNELSKGSTPSETTFLKITLDDRHTRFLEREDEFGPVDSEGIISVSAKVNDTVRLWCDAVGSPPPRITWSHERKDLSHAHGHVLAIPALTVADEGVYHCTANRQRRSWKVVALQPPRWEGSVGNVSACEGSVAEVVCGTLHGQPPPQVYWLLNAKPLKLGAGIQANDSVLHIERAEKQHAGIVQCFACNQLGCAYDGTLLTVVPMQISDEEYLAEAPKTLHSSQHNKKHRKRKPPTLVPPSRPNITRFSDDSVILSWSHQNIGLPVEFYKIQYREVTNSSNGNDWQTDNTRISHFTHSYQIDGLTPNTYYKFRVAAVYSNKDNKQGKSSSKFFLQKGSFQAPATPVLTDVEAISTNSVRLSWTWSREGGVMPDGFYVCYRTVSSAGSYEKAIVAGGAAARSVVISHLLPDTAYEFKIWAYTAQAPSNFSKIKTAKTHRESVVEESSRAAPSDREPAAGAAPPALLTGGVLGAAAVLVLLALTFLLCRRARRPAADKKGSVPESGGANGYIPAKVPITITANPMHAEGGDGGVEMSFIHNNNTGNDDTLPHSRKNGPARQYV
ncbi:interference hedgehog-like isoform X2 [Galleria mellonella]|uniref:Interference hedgehog n=1 Tax=Galleria mellonella TaxID=7137 RepID=A0ABM3MDU9_GALME|nr:interference hedgehog-like isoform X2 [Galleria mellonella]